MRGVEGPLVVVSCVPNVLATEAPGGVPAHCSNMIVGKTVEAKTNEIPGYRPGRRHRATMGMGPSALGLPVADFMLAVIRCSSGD